MQPCGTPIPFFQSSTNYLLSKKGDSVSKQHSDYLADGISPDSLNGRDHKSMAVEDASALLEVLVAVRRGDFSVRMRSDLTGVAGKVADALNDIIAANQRMAQQLEHVGQVVGRDGRTSTRVRFGLSDGPGRKWKDRSTV